MTDSTAVKWRAVFLGAPGAGKGTQAKRLVADHTTLHISSGDMLREHRAKGTDLGQQAREFMDQGKLVPDELIIAMVIERIRQPDASGAWILDGFPRTLPQAQALDQSLQAEGTGLSDVVYFDVPHEVLVGRLTGRWTCRQCGAIWHSKFKPVQVDGVCDLCGGELAQRDDDKAEVVEMRLAEFRALTEPLLEHYRSAGILREVDADLPPNDVYERLVEVLRS